MEKLVIDRTKWLRGEGKGQLLVPPFSQEGFPEPNGGKMCCLGFECIRLGVSPQKIMGAGMPNIFTDREGLSEWLFEVGDSDVNNAARTNDNVLLTEPEREQRISEIFALHGVEVEFVN